MNNVPSHFFDQTITSMQLRYNNFQILPYRNHRHSQE